MTWVPAAAMCCSDAPSAPHHKGRFRSCSTVPVQHLNKLFSLCTKPSKLQSNLTWLFIARLNILQTSSTLQLMSISRHLSHFCEETPEYLWQRCQDLDVSDLKAETLLGVVALAPCLHVSSPHKVREPTDFKIPLLSTVIETYLGWEVVLQLYFIRKYSFSVVKFNILCQRKEKTWHQVPKYDQFCAQFSNLFSAGLVEISQKYQ